MSYREYLQADTRFNPLLCLKDTMTAKWNTYNELNSTMLSEAGAWAFSLAVKTPILVGAETRYKQSTSTVYEFEINDSISAAQYESIPQNNADVLTGQINENTADIAALDGRLATAEDTLVDHGGRIGRTMI